MITRANELRHRLRFRVWIAMLGLRLRRRGGRLIVDAPHGARMGSMPSVEIEPFGDGDATFTLRLGRGVKLGRATHIDIHALGTNVLEMDDGAYLMHGVRLQLRGGAIRMAEHVNVRDGAVLKTEGELILGREVPVSYGATIHCVERVELADRSGLAERVTVADSDHTHHGDDRYFLAAPLKIGPVHIGPNVFVCANAVITRGARIGANSVVAAGAVVGEGEYPEGWLIAGIPARPLRELS